MTIIDGKLTLGGLGTQYYEKGTKEAQLAQVMADTLVATNTKEVLNYHTIPALLGRMTKEVERINGQPIAIGITNVFFSEGGLQSEAQGFDTYYKNFTMKKGTPKQVKVFSHDSQEILDARNAGIDLFKKDADDLRVVADKYVNHYVPFVQLLPLITGSSLTTKVPTLATQGTDDDYCRAFGAIRGEDVSDFIAPIYGITHANHYRVKKGTVIERSDITEIVDLLESYTDYSGLGIVAIANRRLIEDLGAFLYQAPINQDNQAIDGIISQSFLGVHWVDAPQMSKDFIIFLDMGKTDLIRKCVNKDPQQRGFKLLEENRVEGFKVESGVMGLKAYIFEEEYIVPSRHSLAILDVAGAGNPTGEMQDESIERLEKFAERVESMYLGNPRELA